MKWSQIEPYGAKLHQPRERERQNDGFAPKATAQQCCQGVAITLFPEKAKIRAQRCGTLKTRRGQISDSATTLRLVIKRHFPIFKLVFGRIQSTQARILSTFPLFFICLCTKTHSIDWHVDEGLM